MSKIHADNIEEMTDICARLVEKGIIHEARKDGSGWVIELTGGH